MTTVSAVAVLTFAAVNGVHAQSAAQQIAASDIPVIQLAQAAPAQAAQAPATEEIVVTGSRVISNGYDAPTPVTVMGPQQLQSAGQPNIADAVGQLPAFGGDLEGPHSGGNSISTGRAGESQLNLRSLGLTRTLTLLDGHRFVSTDNDGSVDINFFPNGLISRVDVETGGGSAAYGSDALAGVVNFVLDKNFVGFKGDVNGGVRTYGDDRTSNISLTAGTGFAGDRGHIVIDAEYANDPGVFTWDTSPWHATPDHIIANPAYVAGNGQPAYLTELNSSTILYAPGGIITGGPLKGIAFSPTGQPFNYQYGSIINSQYTVGGMSNFTDETQVNQSLTDHLFRDNLFVRANYDLTDEVNVFVQFIHGYSSEWARSKADDTTGIVIKSGNPFIPASIQAQMTAMGLTTFTLGTFNPDLPPLSSRFYRRVWSESGGATGKFDALGTTWSWDVFAQSGNTKSSIFTNVYNTTLLPLADDVVTNPATGAAVCRSTLTAPTNGCVPYNPFGANVNSQAAINYVNGTATEYQNTRQVVEEANVHGNPFDDWAGPVGVAFGIANRYESVYGIVDPQSQASQWTAGNYKPNIGHYSVTEGYAEVELPLAKNVAWAEDFSLNGAMRATDYSTSGYVTTWKIGATYQPIDDVHFRAARSRDIRAPNLAELFAGGQGGQSPGVINPFAGGTTFPTFLNETLGNPNLKPEIAATTSLGVVVTPTFWPGFSASVDFYNINISGAISTASDQINRCFLGEQFYCSEIFSNVNGTVATPADLAAGRVALTDSLPFNLVTQQERGLDFDVTYQKSLGEIVSSWDGSVMIHALISHVSYDRTNDGENPVEDFAGDNAAQGPVKWRYHINETYTNDPYTFGLTERGVSAGNYGPTYLACTSGCPVSTGVAQTLAGDYIPGAWYLDANFAYKFMHKDTGMGDAEAYFSIQNVFNTAPPKVANSSYWYMSTNPFLYDTLGRVFRAGVRFKM